MSRTPTASLGGGSIVARLGSGFGPGQYGSSVGDASPAPGQQALCRHLIAWCSFGDTDFLLGHVGRDVSEQRSAEVAFPGVRQHRKNVGALRGLGADLQ